MRLARFSVADWRNARQVDVDLEGHLTILWGANGAGKTNLLEAVGVLATLRTFRDASWDDVIRFDAPAATVVGRVEGSGGTWHLQVRVTRDPGGRTSREALLDGARVRDPVRYFQRLRAVIFTPDDVRIVRGGPEYRRQYLDRAAFTARPEHLLVARTYRRVLHQRSALLRSGRASRGELEVWTHLLVEAGVPLIQGRQRAVEALNPVLGRLHGELSGGRAELAYRSVAGTGDAATLAAALQARLAGVAAEERRRGTTLAGPHRDELEIRYLPEGEAGCMRLAREFGSQGQVRGLALALKLAELEVAGQEGGELPLLLMDDLSSELDAGRRGRLVDLLESLRAQVIVTTTDPDPVARQAHGPVQLLRVVSGAVAPGGASG